MYSIIFNALERCSLPVVTLTGSPAPKVRLASATVGCKTRVIMHTNVVHAFFWTNIPPRWVCR